MIRNVGEALKINGAVASVPPTTKNVVAGVGSSNTAAFPTNSNTPLGPDCAGEKMVTFAVTEVDVAAVTTGKMSGSSNGVIPGIRNARPVTLPRFVPVTVNVNPVSSAPCVDGEIPVIDGAAALVMVKNCGVS